MKNFEMQLNHLIRQKGDTTFETVSAIGEQLQVKLFPVQRPTANLEILYRWKSPPTSILEKLVPTISSWVCLRFVSNYDSRSFLGTFVSFSKFSKVDTKKDIDEITEPTTLDTDMNQNDQGKFDFKHLAAHGLNSNLIKTRPIRCRLKHKKVKS